MSELPPPLAWLDSFRVSTSRALGEELQLSVQPTVNPLVYQAILQCPYNTSGGLRTGVWNLLQIWAAKNDCQLQGKNHAAPQRFEFQLVTKRRLGAAKNDWPWG